MNKNIASDMQQLVKALYEDIADLPLLSPTAGEKKSPSPQITAQTLEAYEREIRFCTSCDMHIGRANLVFGRGNPAAKLMFVGDFPSRADDAAGKIFSDNTGELLKKMIIAMKFQPDEVYLVNLLQCRPPRGSRPSEKEFRVCDKHFRSQLNSVKPSHIVALGEMAARVLSNTDSPLSALRKQKFDLGGIELQCTHHPRDLETELQKKKEAWTDLQTVMRSIGKI